MKEVWAAIHIGIAWVGGLVGWYFGNMGGIMYALLAFVIVDYITGIIKGIITKKLSSSVGAKGIAKKVMLFLIVGIAHLADLFLLNDSGALRTAVIFFYISNEGLSIIENAAAIGLPIPLKLNVILAKLHDNTNEHLSSGAPGGQDEPEPAKPRKTRTSQKKKEETEDK